MRVRVWVPTEVILDEEISKLRAESPNGWFGILPHHIDYVACLVPGILCLQLTDGAMEYLAIDDGVLVKCGPDVSVSTRNAVRGQEPERLKAAVERQFREARQKEQASHAFEAKLEAELVRELLELERHA